LGNELTKRSGGSGDFGALLMTALKDLENIGRLPKPTREGSFVASRATWKAREKKRTASHLKVRQPDKSPSSSISGMGGGCGSPWPRQRHRVSRRGETTVHRNYRRKDGGGGDQRRKKNHSIEQRDFEKGNSGGVPWKLGK